MLKKGKTVIFENPPVITGHAGVAGKKEGEGPLAESFDAVFEDTSLGRSSYELAESAMLNRAICLSLDSAGKSPSELDYILSGDLLNQCVGSSFAVKDLGVASIGMYGACSTMALTLATSAMLIDAGATCCAAAASSHFCSSERQFRYPLEYGGQRPPTAQWTVTGAGSAVVENQASDNSLHARITAAHIGTITDFSITDPANMGAAMAPAAVRTIGDFLENTESRVEDYDLILTGDLGFVGSRLLHSLLESEYGIVLGSRHNDCGLMIFDLKRQDVNSGGSGCGCSASVLCSHILKQMEQGSLHKVLFVATGALMSTTTSKQGSSIPGIAHAVLLEV